MVESFVWPAIEESGRSPGGNGEASIGGIAMSNMSQVSGMAAPVLAGAIRGSANFTRGITGIQTVPVYGDQTKGAIRLGSGGAATMSGNGSARVRIGGTTSTLDSLIISGTGSSNTGAIDFWSSQAGVLDSLGAGSGGVNITDASGLTCGNALRAM